jgi:hypothetical protein
MCKLLTFLCMRQSDRRKRAPSPGASIPSSFVIRIFGTGCRHSILCEIFAPVVFSKSFGVSAPGCLPEGWYWRIGLRRIRIAFFVSTSLLFTGCATSLQQVAPDDGTVFDPSLLGTWEVVDESASNSQAVVTSPNHQTYEVSIRDSDKPITHVASLILFRINGNLFFDLAFARAEVNGVEINTGDMEVQPLHFFGRIWIQPDEVRMSALSADWLRKNLAAKNLSLQHLPFKEKSIVGDDVTLIGSPQEIRDFAARYADNKDAFGDPGVLRRKK